MVDGAPANVSIARFGTHTATHVDAPYHVLEGGACVDELPLEPFIGPATVVESSGRSALDRDFMRELLGRHPGVERILFRTRAWVDPGRFPEHFPPIDSDAAALIVASGILLVGTDAPSVDPVDSEDLPAHRTLLSAGVVIIENLLLDVPDGLHELIALPMRIVAADAAPVRALLRTA